MFDKYSSRPGAQNRKRRWLIASIAGVIVAVSVAGLRFVSFDNNIELMLPESEEIKRNVRFLQDSHISDKVILSLNIVSSQHTTSDLIGAVDRLTSDLNPPMITEVVSGISEMNGVEAIDNFLKYVPQLITEEDLSRIEEKISPAGVKESLSGYYRRLLNPSSTFIKPFVRSDPLGISFGFLRTIEKLSSSMGYDISIKEGHFISRDGSHALMVLKTPVKITDGFGSRKLISYLHHQLKNLPDFVSADIIAGHLHTVSNEDIMKRDIKLMLIIASPAFILLFLFIFRDIRAILIFFMPLAAIIVSINLSYFILGKLSYFIIGMGAVVAGIAVDYGIHVYLAVRTGGETGAVKLIAKPVIIGALTTISIFVAFFFSSVQGYHQLALFSIISIILCLTGALLILPIFFRGISGRRFPGISIRRPIFRGRIPDRIRVAGWGLIIIVAVILSLQLKFSSDITQFDGTEPGIISDEEEFHKVWGGENQPAVLVLQGDNLEKTLQINDSIYQEVEDALGEDNLSSLAKIWPSEKTRSANIERWNDFWTDKRRTKLKNLLLDEGEPYNFSEDAFSPFFRLVNKYQINEYGNNGCSFIDRLKEKFILERKDNCQVLSFFPDEDGYITDLLNISRRHPEAFPISRKAFSRALSQAIWSETVFISVIAAILITISTWLLLKKIRLVLLALIPVITAIILLLGILPLLGLYLNAPSIIAGMVVMGLSIDYGIFMVYASRYNYNTGTRTAVSLSALTTLIGAGVLLFAQHPVLFSIGVTLVTGVLVGYLSSMLIVPPLYRLWFPTREGSLSKTTT